MKHKGLGLLVALTLLLASLPGTALGEELGEIDLFSPEIYAGEAPAEAPAEPEPVEAAQNEAAQPEPVEAAQDEAAQPESVEAAQDEAAQPEPVEAAQNETAQPEPVEAARDEAAQPEPVAAAQGEAVEPEAVPEAQGEIAGPEAAEPAPEAAESAPEDAPSEADPAGEAPAQEPPAEAAAVEAPLPEAVAAPEAFPEALVLGLKETFVLNGLALSGGQPVRYASSKPKSVRVDENGLVTAARKGSAVVTCYLDETPLASCQVTVLKAPRKVTLPQKSAILSAGEARSFPAALPKGSAGAVSYASDNPAVLTVDAAGTLYGVSGGTATLTARTYNGKTAACSVRVLSGPAPTWVSLNPGQLQLSVKGTARLSAEYDPGCDAALAYATSNKKIASVTADGLVTGLRAGQATITVTTHNGLTASCPVQVYTAPKKVTLNVKKLTLNVNDGYQLTATLTKNSVSEITWASSNPAVATVDGSGLVAAVGAGTAQITATTANGKKATCKLTVRDPGAAGIDPQGSVVYQEDSETLKVKIVNDRGILLTYIWAQDPSRQLFKAYGNGGIFPMLQGVVNADSSLQGKIIIGFNASSPVNEKFHPDWNKDPVYHHREPSPLLIANGQVLANDPNKIALREHLYWLDGSGRLCFSEKPLSQMTAEERGALYQRVIDSGARNTLLWYPPLVSDYKAVPIDESVLKRFSGKLKKQALCQVDANNFILVSSTSGGVMTFPEFQRYLLRLGVKTAVTLDGGGSTTLLCKPRSTASVQRLLGGTRQLSMVVYFTELD